MCTLYSMTKGQAEIRDEIDIEVDRTGNLASLPAIFPDQMAPVVRIGPEGRELVLMRWGMPTPSFALKNRRTDGGVANIRNVRSPHWRPWLGPENRCLVPFTSFSEYGRTSGGSPEAVWFAIDESRPLSFFAGIWTRWTSVRKLAEGETTNDLFGFLTTEPNDVVGAVHPRAMPTILDRPEEREIWLKAPAEEALALQRPLADGALEIVARGAREDGARKID